MLLIFHYRERYDKACALAKFAFNPYLAFMQVYNLLDVCQPQAESLCVVPVAGVHPVELLKNLLQVVFLDSDAVIGNHNLQTSVRQVTRRYPQLQVAIVATVLDRIVEKVEDDIGKVHLVDINQGNLRIENSVNMTTVFLNFQFERIDNVDGTLCIQLILDKEWTDFIGTKPDAQYRRISVKLPKNIIRNLFVKTTNADIDMQPTVISDSLFLDVNGGNITFDTLSTGNNIDLTVKNGNINGSIVGGWDDFAISCQIKKGESNLPENKEGGDKRLSVNCNNGDVVIDFI